MSEKRELIKINCQAVVLVKEGDKVLREETTQSIGCYSLEQMSEFYANAKSEVDQMNEATKSNRQRRRTT